MTTPTNQSKDSGLAIASLVLGILSVTSFSILTGIPALVTGIIGLRQGQDRGMSLAGIIMGGISVVFAVFFILFFILILALGVTSSSNQIPDTRDSPRDDSSFFRQQT